MADRPGVWQCTYYPSTESLVPPYQHRDYAPDFETDPQWTDAVEDADGYCTWTGSGNAMSWTPEETPNA